MPRESRTSRQLVEDGGHEGGAVGVAGGGDPAGGLRAGVGVAVEADQAQPGVGVEHRQGVTGQARGWRRRGRHRGGAGGGEQLGDPLQEHGDVHRGGAERRGSPPGSLLLIVDCSSNGSCAGSSMVARSAASAGSAAGRVAGFVLVLVAAGGARARLRAPRGAFAWRRGSASGGCSAGAPESAGPGRGPGRDVPSGVGGSARVDRVAGKATRAGTGRAAGKAARSDGARRVSLGGAAQDRVGIPSLSIEAYAASCSAT